MYHISIISSSIRIGRNSHRVALYFQDFMQAHHLAEVEIIDLKHYNFPLFDERIQFQKKPKKNALEFAEKIKSADGILIVTPEYNGGYPASLKNAIDLLYDEWLHKPIAISTVSTGFAGGAQALISLQFTLWKMKAQMITATFPVPDVVHVFDKLGHAISKSETDPLAHIFINELITNVRMIKKRNAK
jgi:NAD(P)H-dependent FMN reductase